MHSNSILGVTLLHCRFVFCESLPQSPSCFADVDMVALSTGYFVNHSFLVQFKGGLLHFHQGFSHLAPVTTNHSDPKGVADMFNPLGDSSNVW